MSVEPKTLLPRFLRRTSHYDQGYQFALVVVLSLLCFITLAPFIWVVLTAFKPNAEIYTTNLQILPQQPTLEQFQRVIEKGDQLPGYIINTLFYSVVTITVVVIFASMAGYALGMLRFRGAQLIVNAILGVLSIPWIILVVPILIFEFRLNIWNTRLGLILPYIGLFLPVAIWIMRGNFIGLPRELGEAARIDGASELSVFWRVYLPMARGGVATVVLLTFIDIWNEVLLAASLAINPQIANINTGLRILADEGQSFAFGTLSAAILIAMIPTLIVFVVLQRYYVRGISEGALAGF
ncbi:MAG: carbohydrate ABC transporter permease [Anaerolineae bacterium]|nr:carbohydrate ABC transporter permease [Anaerolineae bacterium]